MRYLSFLVALLASAPVCAAEYTHTVELNPGFAERWEAPRPFKNIITGNSHIVDVVQGATDKELLIIAKPGEVGSTNIVLTDENGAQVANVLVTNNSKHYQLGRSGETGRLQFYRNEEKCYSDCVSLTTPQSNTPPPSDK
jgi:Flp pilus assembly secretin CpaC